MPLRDLPARIMIKTHTGILALLLDITSSLLLTRYYSGYKLPIKL